MVVRELITLLGFKLEDSEQKKYNKELDETKGKSNALAAAGKGIGTAYKIAAVAVAVGVGWISKNILDATIEMEGYRTQITQFTGDADEAADVLARLRDNTVDPLFGTGNLVNAYKQLRTVGMEAQSAENMIGILGDVANGSVENFNALSQALSNSAATGKVNIKMLTNAGFGLEQMSRATGKGVDQLKNEIEKGTFAYKDLALAMQNATAEGGEFYGNALRQAKTLGGSIKIIQDVIGSMGDAIGTKVLPQIVDLIHYITDLLKLGNDGIVNMGVKAFQGIINGIADAIIWIEVMQMRLKAMGASFEPVKAIIDDIFSFAASVFRSFMPVLINLAGLFISAFKPIQAIVRPILEALKPVIHDVFAYAADLIAFLIPIIQKLTPPFKVLGNIIGAVISVFANGGLAVVKALLPLVGIILAIVGAMKLWVAIQTILNIVMTANPIGLIILAIIALIGLIVLLIKNWQKVIDFFAGIGKAIAGFFKKMWDGIVNIFKKYGKTILQVLAIIIFGIPGLIVFAVKQIIKHWDVIGPALKKIWDKVVSVFKAIWKKIVDIAKTIFNAILNVVNIVINKLKQAWLIVVSFFVTLFETIKGVFTTAWNVIINVFKSVIGIYKDIWNGVIEFFKSIWNGIKDIAISVWNGIKDVFFSVVGAIKGAWQEFTDSIANFFSWVGDAAANVWNGIRETFLGVFDKIKETFLGFIDVISNGWEKVKGFFGGVGEGVVNFFTGGNKEKGGTAESAPLLKSAMAATAGVTNNYTTSSSSGTSMNVNSPVTVNVPSGTSAEQSQAIARQVQAQMQNELSNAINGSRGSIPSPERRRN